MLDKKDIERRMGSAFESVKKDFSGLSTGRASIALLDSVIVDVYGAKMPISQVATVSVAEARLLTVQVWDANNTKAVEKAIANAALGLNPQPSGTLIRVPIPGLTEERRIELAKVASKYAENGRISVRSLRREGMEEVKKLQKSKEISEDEQKKEETAVQKMTDEWIKKIDDTLIQKEQEIKQV